MPTTRTAAITVKFSPEEKAELLLILPERGKQKYLRAALLGRLKGLRSTASQQALEQQLRLLAQNLYLLEAIREEVIRKGPQIPPAVYAQVLAQLARLTIECESKLKATS